MKLNIRAISMNMKLRKKFSVDMKGRKENTTEKLSEIIAMNEADRKAFREWNSDNGVAATPLSEATRFGACEHKQREIDALKARVARLEIALDSISAIGTTGRSLDVANIMLESVMETAKVALHESPTQSLAEVKAATLREAAADIDDGKFYSQINPNGVELGSGGVFSKRLKERAGRILQEAKDA